MPAEKWREISAFCLTALALLLSLSLISNGWEQRWIGAVGDAMAGSATFILGGMVAYVLPFLLLLAAIHAFKGRTPFHPVRKTLSGVLILLALCAMLSLRYALSEEPEARELSLFSGGVVGTFLTSDDSYALNLAGLCGPMGAYLVCLVMLLLGVMLSTDFLFVPIIRRLVAKGRARVKKWKRPAPVATLVFDRGHSQRVFPSIGADSEKGSAASGTKSPDGGDSPDDKADPPLLSPDAGLFPEERSTEEEKPSVPEDKNSGIPEIFSSLTRKKSKKKSRGDASMGAMIQTELNFNVSDFETPPIDIFSMPEAHEDTMDREEVLEISGELERALADFNISARVVAVTQGPVVTQYEIQPAPGIKVSRILSLENDIALILRAKSVRIQAPIPGKAAVGVEVPNRKVTPVYFKELIDTDDFRHHASPLAFTLGKNISGEHILCDLATMPHLLIAGTTGSGKSVCVNCIISSILYRMPPDRVKFIMIDPKRVELNVYSDIPHLLSPVVNDPRQSAAALMWAVQQMEERLEAFSKLRVRNIDGYNDLVSGKREISSGIDIEGYSPLPHIIIVIDELADLMIIARNEVEEFIVRLAQMSRAAGIHMIIATQRPSVNVLTGIIKANFPSRIAFRVSAKVDSRTILDMNGAETLLGRGDMLFAPGGTKPMRIQGAFLGDRDVERLTEFLRAQTPTDYEKEGFSANELKEPVPEERGDIGSDGSYETVHQKSETSPGDPPGRIASPAKAKQLTIPTELTAHAGPKTGQVEFPELILKGDRDEDEILFDKALRLVLETRKPSVSMIQRRMKIGFARAGRIMDLMEDRGIVGPYLGSKPRDLIVDDPDALLRRLDEMERDAES